MSFLDRRLPKNKYLDWIINYIKFISVWSWFLYVGASAIYYIHREVYVETGMQTDTIGSTILVVLIVIGAFVLTRTFLQRKDVVVAAEQTNDQKDEQSAETVLLPPGDKNVNCN